MPNNHSPYLISFKWKQLLYWDHVYIDNSQQAVPEKKNWTTVDYLSEIRINK